MSTVVTTKKLHEKCLLSSGTVVVEAIAETEKPFKSNVLLVGSGGVGTIASLSLELSGKASVTSVLRTDYKRVIERGFSIDSVDHGKFDQWRPTKVVPNVEAAVEYSKEPYEFIVVAMKVLPELYQTHDVIRPAVTPGYTTIVLIQNGIGIEKPVSEAFPDNVVLSGISMIGSHNYSGRIAHYAPDILSIGYFDNGKISKELQESKAKQFIEMYAASGVTCNYASDLMFSRWKKLVYNSCINTVCGISQLDTGRSYMAGIDRALILPAMGEILAIAKAAGYDLPTDIENTMLEVDDGVYYKPSMQVDIEKGNPIEVEVILGNPLKIAQQLGVATPTLTVLYHILTGVQFRLMEARGLIKCPPSPPLRTEVEYGRRISV